MDTNILVSVAKTAGRDLVSVSADLADAGMKVMDVLKYSRVVTGTVSDESKLDKIRKVPGVSSVELDREFTAGG